MQKYYNQKMQTMPYRKVSKLLEACHYTNLQPLWASDNISKGDYLNWEKKETVL